MGPRVSRVKSSGHRPKRARARKRIAAAALQPVASPHQALAAPELNWIYDTAPIGLAFLTPDCRYLQINQRLTEICGISVAGFHPRALWPRPFDVLVRFRSSADNLGHLGLVDHLIGSGEQ